MAEPSGHVLLFVGHTVDLPGQARPRFSPDKESIAKEAIRQALIRETESAGRPMCGITSGSPGGDILFLEVCGEHGIPTRLYLPMPTKEFIAEAVAPAGEY